MCVCVCVCVEGGGGCASVLARANTAGVGGQHETCSSNVGVGAVELLTPLPPAAARLFILCFVRRFFFYHIDEKDPTEFTFLEQFVAQKLLEDDLDFFPLNRALGLQYGAYGTAGWDTSEDDALPDTGRDEAGISSKLDQVLELAAATPVATANPAVAAGDHFDDSDGPPFAGVTGSPTRSESSVTAADTKRQMKDGASLSRGQAVSLVLGINETVLPWG